jgi:DNA-binding transcriptional ArsR family regulator
MAEMLMILYTKTHGNLTMEFEYSPFFEMVCSLHVLSKPEHHLERLEWAEEMKTKLPAALYEELAYFGKESRSRCAAMDFCKVSDSIVDMNTIAVVDAIAAMDIKAFFRVLFSGVAAAELPNDPEGFRRRFIAALKAYYFQFFESELRYMEPLLIRILKKQTEVCDELGVKEFIKTIHGRIEVTEDKIILHKHRVFILTYDNIRKILIRISAFIAPHLLIGIEGPSCLELTFRAHLQEAAHQVPMDLFKTMKALGDDTRLRILKVIKKDLSSTQSLAAELGLTEACISKHLKVLAEADLLYKQRRGNYVYYLLNQVQLDRIPMDIHQYLDA